MHVGGAQAYNYTSPCKFSKNCSTRFSRRCKYRMSTPFNTSSFSSIGRYEIVGAQVRDDKDSMQVLSNSIRQLRRRWWYKNLYPLLIHIAKFMVCNWKLSKSIWSKYENKRCTSTGRLRLPESFVKFHQAVQEDMRIQAVFPLLIYDYKVRGMPYGAQWKDRMLKWSYYVWN